jgi:hypothetical protein
MGAWTDIKAAVKKAGQPITPYQHSRPSNAAEVRQMKASGVDENPDASKVMGKGKKKEEETPLQKKAREEREKQKRKREARAAARKKKSADAGSGKGKKG